MEITVVMRDMYMTGTDTVVLAAWAAKAYQKATDKSRFLANLETVVFTAPYPIKETVK